MVCGRLAPRLLAVLTWTGLSALAATGTLVLSADGLTVYDSANNITWLANANFAGSNRFGVAPCTGTPASPQTCVNPSGSMNYGSAAAWVAAMNAARYLGHSDWQLPTTPPLDSGCGKKGPNGNSFGFGCSASAFGTLYNALGFKAPNPAVTTPANSAGPFVNFQPYLYWSQTSAGGNGQSTFSFNNGFNGANTGPNFLFVLPMVAGKLPGTPAATGNALQVNPGGQTIYDPVSNVTWLADANLAASNPFGLPRCADPVTPALCVAPSGAMTVDSATQFLANMNAYGGTGYLGQKTWQLAPVDPNCGTYRCKSAANPMGELYYGQFGLNEGSPVTAFPDEPAGPFHNFQPYLYWACHAATIQTACDAQGPNPNMEWSFSFGSGFEGTDILQNELYVTAYFVGTRTSTPLPTIALVANAEGENPAIAPNTWVEIKGANLAPAGDIRIWQTADFATGKMPTQLDGVSATVNGKAAFVYYISPTQVNILTPPDAMTGNVQVVVNNNGAASVAYTAQAQAISPSFFVISGGPYVVAQHSTDNTLVGPPNLYRGATTPAKPLETVVLYANGFGPISPAVTSGAISQFGTLNPLPVVTIGGIAAKVTYGGINGPPGLFQFNVEIPAGAATGDNQIVATYNNVASSPATLIAIQSTAPSTSAVFYVATNGNDSWSGAMAAPNPAGTDGPFATFDRARAAVQALNKTGLTQVNVQFRGGTYYLTSTEQLSAADSGTAALSIVYSNFPGESPVFSGGVRVQNWTSSGGNVWKASLPAATRYFENLFYDGTRRLRPRVGGYLGTYLRIVSPVYLAAPDATGNCTINVAGSGYECFDRFQYNPADPIAATWRNLAPPAGNLCGQPAGNAALVGDIELLDFEQFVTSKLRISCVDTVKHIVYLTGPTGFSQINFAQNGYIPGHRYLVENVQDQLTQPGQWFLDRSTTPWTLTYLANSGEDPNADQVVIPQLGQVLVGSNLQYVTLRGLTFSHDNFTVPAAGYISQELDPGVSAAVSFQNSRQITFDSNTVTQTSGAGLEMISCVNGQSPAWCVARSVSAATGNSVVENSAFYDLGGSGVRIGEPSLAADTDSNTPQFVTVDNNVVEGWGRVFPGTFGIGQGAGHDNTYTHNEVNDGYHVAISVCQCGGDVYKPSGGGTFNNTIAFNHVWNLEQGIMNDGGSIRVGTGNSVFTAAGNKILNNRIHDVSDASALDADGYGGNGIYLDNQTGLVDVENNLVYRVSANAVNLPQGPPVPGEANTIKNNILAYARGSLINISNPYSTGALPSTEPLAFAATNNIFYFDRTSASDPAFYTQGGCTYTGSFPFTSFQQWNSNVYWRTDGGFASDAQGFHVQTSAGTNQICSGNQNKWTFYNFAGWQQKVGEDTQSVVQNPQFKNPGYPADDYSLPKGSPGGGFVVFDVTAAGRKSAVLKPPAVAAGFPTKLFDPGTEY